MCKHGRCQDALGNMFYEIVANVAVAGGGLRRKATGKRSSNRDKCFGPSGSLQFSVFSHCGMRVQASLPFVGIVS